MGDSMSSKIKAGTSSSGVVLDADNTGILELQSGSTPTTAVTIDASQNVGVGTTSPDYKLVVDGEGVNGGFALKRTGTLTGNSSLRLVGSSGSEALGFSVNATERMRITSAGYLGIGTSSPAYSLDVSGNARIGGSAIITGDISQSGSNVITNTNSSLYLQTSTAQPVIFRTNSTEAMRILSTGTVLVGKTAVADGTSGLTFYGGATGSIGLGTTGSAGTNQLEFFRGTEGSLTRVGSVQTTGSATIYQTSSDYRLKENIQPMAGALDKVAQLKPCTYTWKLDGAAGQGFIAHELQAVVPDCVTGTKDAVDENGKPDYQGIDTSFLVATLTAAIQEQQALITTLQTQVAALQEKVGI
jgi:hypothetical protein